LSVISRDRGDQLVNVERLERFERLAEYTNPALVLPELGYGFEPGVELVCVGERAEDCAAEEPGPGGSDGVVQGTKE